ncbi:MAG: Gfo/Idh/MocA family oxidoreductase, partial [Bacillota bacterium]|nr:Gfo/Idh/MocA family oxidoreductase [Bacillota bacterium]
MLNGVIVGCYEHVNLIASIFEANQVAVLGFAPGGPDEDITCVPTLEKRFDHMRLFDDYREMLQEIKPDLAGLSPRIDRIADIASQALAASVHCLCEKPLAVTWDQLKRLDEACATSRAKLTCLLSMRYDPAFYTLHKQVQAGAIGDPVLVSMQKSYQLGTRAAYFQKRSLYGGILPFIGSHTLDLTHFITGKHFQTFSCWQTMCHNGGNREMESAACCQFTFREGGGGVNYLDYFRPGTTADWADNRMRVVGSCGIIETDGANVILISDRHDTRLLPLDSAGPAFADYIFDIRQHTDDCILKTSDCLYVAK